MLLKINVGDLVAIRSGFASGYGGEGPWTFSVVLQLLDANGTEIDEIEVQQEVLDKVDRSLLTKADIEAIENARPVRPSRWYGYIEERHRGSDDQQSVWDSFPPMIPFAIVDIRVIDLALNFWEEPDERLLTGYRRLEDIIRARIGSRQHGQKLFSQAFLGPNSKLMWINLDEAEQTGRANLFVGTYMAYRNPHAHRELPENPNQQLAEFLLLNHLYVLEREARRRPGTEKYG